MRRTILLAFALLLSLALPACGSSGAGLDDQAGVEGDGMSQDVLGPGTYTVANAYSVTIPEGLGIEQVGYVTVRSEGWTMLVEATDRPLAEVYERFGEHYDWQDCTYGSISGSRGIKTGEVHSGDMIFVFDSQNPEVSHICFIELYVDAEDLTIEELLDDPVVNAILASISAPE